MLAAQICLSKKKNLCNPFIFRQADTLEFSIFFFFLSAEALLQFIPRLLRIKLACRVQTCQKIIPCLTWRGASRRKCLGKVLINARIDNDNLKDNVMRMAKAIQSQWFHYQAMESQFSSTIMKETVFVRLHSGLKWDVSNLHAAICRPAVGCFAATVAMVLTKIWVNFLM